MPNLTADQVSMLDNMCRVAGRTAIGTAILALQEAVDDLAAAATATAAGLVELATSAEAITGTDEARAVTPKALADAVTTHVTAATDAAAGKVELATDAEALVRTDAARAVTPHALGAVVDGLDIISFTGNNGAGACVAVGLKAGDIVLAVTGAQAGVIGSLGASFEATISVADQIQQTDVANLSANTYMAFILRQS
jgi:hypothetical protein